MPSDILYPLVNGHRFSFASIQAEFNGLPFLGFKSLNYTGALEPGELRGTHPLVLGRTRGNFSSDASFEMYRLEFEALKATLGLGGNGFMETAFEIVCCYSEELWQPPVLITDVLVSCRIKKVSFSNTQGTDGSSVQCDLHLMNLLLDGVPPVKQTGPLLGGG